MPLEIFPLEEADLPVYYDIVWEADHGDLQRAMWPNGYPQETRDWSVVQSTKDMRTAPETNKYMKVIDTDLPADDPHHQILGIAKWHVYPRERTDEEMEAEALKQKDSGPPPNADPAFIEHYFALSGATEKEIIGNKAHVSLAMLFTHPERSRRGAGSMHVKWGVDLADELGIPAYLDSSPAGRGLYEKHGFEVVRVLPMDLRRFNIAGDTSIAFMSRPIKKASTAT